ncbi:hypothetical protein GIB67_037297 [Kingdonia uniflora]|uniref:Uncharacterized protein n=1 Tax=Kingdonia uniflora TaxID=39325 RepID=A0A7J7MS94_9MAGN|nr:hypothetical protein GIB67_037297 [Kingdonia uniflora]
MRFSKLHLLNFTNKPTTTAYTSFIVWVRRKSSDYYFVSYIDGSLVVKRYGRIGFPIRNMWLWSISQGVIFLQRSNSRYPGSLAMGKYAQVLELDPRKTGCYSFGMGFSVSTKELKVVSAKNMSTKKELVDLSSRHGYMAYALVAAVVQRRSTVTVVNILGAVGMIEDVWFGRYIHGFYVACGRVEFDVREAKTLNLALADNHGSHNFARKSGGRNIIATNDQELLRKLRKHNEDLGLGQRHFSREKQVLHDCKADKNPKYMGPQERQIPLPDKEREKERRKTTSMKSMDAWKEKRNWEDILASPLGVSSRVSHLPGIGRENVERAHVFA